PRPRCPAGVPNADDPEHAEGDIQANGHSGGPAHRPADEPPHLDLAERQLLGQPAVVPRAEQVGEFLRKPLHGVSLLGLTTNLTRRGRCSDFTPRETVCGPGRVQRMARATAFAQSPSAKGLLPNPSK